MRNSLSRRSFFALPAALFVVSACKKDPGAPPPPQSAGRCSHCGMKLKPESPWLAEIVSDDGQKLTFDAPRCAFAASLGGTRTITQIPATMAFLDIPDAERERMGIHPGMVRVAAGLEHADDLVADFSQALALA